MRQLGAIFGPLLEARTPAWWRYEYDRGVEQQGPLHLLPRDPVWLRVELPRHIERGQRIANAILVNPAEADEAVADALIRTEGVPYVPQNFGAYFDRAVRNAAFDILRRRGRRPALVSLDALATQFDFYYPSPGPEDEAIAEEAAAMVRRAVEQLTAVEQAAVRLHYIEGLSIRESAIVLGRTRFDTQNILVRARRKLFRALAPQVRWREPVRRGASHRREAVA